MVQLTSFGGSKISHYHNCYCMRRNQDKDYCCADSARPLLCMDLGVQLVQWVMFHCPCRGFCGFVIVQCRAVPCPVMLSALRVYFCHYYILLTGGDGTVTLSARVLIWSGDALAESLHSAHSIGFTEEPEFALMQVVAVEPPEKQHGITYQGHISRVQQVPSLSIIPCS